MVTTINYKGIDFDVHYEFFPEEEVVMYYKDGSGHPGCPASIEIESITMRGVEFYGFLDSLNLINEINEITLEKILER